MNDAPKRGLQPWTAFLAGAVAMLAIGLAIFAWRGMDDAANGARIATGATRVLPDLPAPRVPDAPRLPDAPLPLPN